MPATIVLCHGFGGSARNFRPQLRALGGPNRVVSYDMRGHARSEKPRDATDYRLDCLVGDLASVVEEHAKGRAIVGGLSLGAAVALEYAVRRPEHVAGLMLAAYPAEPNELRSWALGFANGIEELGLEMAGDRHVWGSDSRFDARARHLIKMGFMEHAPWAMTALLRQTIASLGAVGARSAQLRRVQVPTRIVVGSDDSGSLGPCRALATLIPHARLTVIDGAGHVVNLVRPVEFNEELSMLIAEVTA